MNDNVLTDDIAMLIAALDVYGWWLKENKSMGFSPEHALKIEELGIKLRMSRSITLDKI